MTDPFGDDAGGLTALASAQLRRPPGWPLREMLAEEDPLWTDDLHAWRLVQRLVRVAHRRLVVLRQVPEHADARDLARARWLYGLALDLAEEVRGPAVRAERARNERLEAAAGAQRN